jgi:hypothetical protein
MTTSGSLTEHAAPGADPDVLTDLRRLIEEFFAAVSFTPGGRPQYERITALFLPGARLIRAGSDRPEISTVAEFIEPRQRLADSGELESFREMEVADITEVFGSVAHRLSTYAKNGVSSGGEFAGRGVIFTQFVRTPDGWRMASMAWDDERPGLSLPDRYR